MGILEFFQSSRQRTVKVIAAQISNIHAAAFLSQGAAEAQQVVTEGFLDWLVPQIIWDENPEVSARELCREILARVADAQRAIGTGAIR
jgi:hypothetical protein